MLGKEPRENGVMQMKISIVSKREWSTVSHALKSPFFSPCL